MTSTFRLKTPRPQAGPARACDESAVRAALALLVRPDFGVQIQGLPSARWRILAGDDVEGMIACVRWLEDDRGTYVALNPCPRGRSQAIVNGCMVERRWLLLDVDPERPKDANATEEEHETARAAAYAALDYLSSCGWPLPVVVDSGNGWHLLYRISLENDEGGQSRALVKNAIYAIADRFDVDGAHFDRAVHDAKRITKLPGTWARKGPHSDERPHRLARIVYTPETVEVVTADQLAAVAAIPPDEDAGQDTVVDPVQAHEAFCLRANSGGEGSARAYARVALEREIAKVLLAPVGTRNNVYNAACFSIGTLAGAGAILRQEAEQGLKDAARRAGLGATEIDRTFESGFGAGEAKPRDIPERNGPAGSASHGGQEQPSGEWSLEIDGRQKAHGKWEELLVDRQGASRPERQHFEVRSLDRLLSTSFPPPMWVVPGMLSEGLNILAGRPKQGKSMLALNLAITVAAGGMALGDIQTTRGDVLYLSLEDKDRRVQSRAKKIVSALNQPEAAKRLYIVTNWPTQDRGGLQLIDRWREEVERPVLLIIDVWGRFRPMQDGKANAYEQDYRHLGEVKRYCDEASLSGLVLHHTKKGQSEDDVEAVSGTAGLTGVADGIMILKRARNDNDAQIFVTGRDGPEQELAVRFNPEALTWTSLGSARDYLTGKLQTAILAYLKSLNGESAFTTDIAARVESDGDTVRKALHRLHDRRLIRRAGKAWAYPAEDDRAADDETAF